MPSLSGRKDGWLTVGVSITATEPVGAVGSDQLKESVCGNPQPGGKGAASTSLLPPASKVTRSSGSSIGPGAAPDVGPVAPATAPGAAVPQVPTRVTSAPPVSMASVA